MATAAIVPAEQPQPASLMTVIERLASNPNVDIDKLRQLLEMQERWELNRDKSALRHAMAEFKKNPPQIIKERVAKVKPKDDSKFEFTYSYADLENITSAIESGLAEYGVTHSWITKDTGAQISIACVLKYGLYEEIGEPLVAGPDTSGAKNAIQAKGSTISYLEKYTLLAATGMAAGMPDTDGAGLQQSAKENVVEDILACKTLTELQSTFSTAYMLAAKRPESQKAFKTAYDRRKAELSKEAA